MARQVFTQELHYPLDLFGRFTAEVVKGAFSTKRGNIIIQGLTQTKVQGFKIYGKVLDRTGILHAIMTS